KQHRHRLQNRRSPRPRPRNPAGRRPGTTGRHHYTLQIARGSCRRAHFLAAPRQIAQIGPGNYDRYIARAPALEFRTMFNWLRQFFRSSRGSAVQAHITFGATSVGRSISRTGLLLKKQLWIWPIIAIVLLACVGLGIRVAIERTMKASLRSQ